MLELELTEAMSAVLQDALASGQLPEVSTRHAHIQLTLLPSRQACL